MRMTIDVMLDMEWAIEGRDCRLPVPPGLVTLWRRARDAGFVLDMLYVLDEPLHPGIAGQYNRETGDIWILHDPSDPSRMAAHLIHELAHAARDGRPVDDRWLLPGRGRDAAPGVPAGAPLGHGGTVPG